MSENNNALVPYSDIERMGLAIAKSGLFGMKTPEQAVALMLIAQAEGMHPAIAARDYHIIQGRPALKADAMLARFQAAGGHVEWTSYTDQKVTGVFSIKNGGSVTIDWDVTRAKAAGLYDKEGSMFKKYPRQMMRARVISEGIRTVFPGCVSGFYTPEEVQDSVDDKKPPKDVTPKSEPVCAQPMTPEQAAETVGGMVIDGSTGDVHDVVSTPLATGPQLNAIGAILTKLGIKDDMTRHEKVSTAIGLSETVTSMKNLTKSQASEAIKALGDELNA